MATLVPAPADGAAPSLDALYSEHNGWLKRWLQQRLGCPERAADIAQDTFVRILLKETPPQIEKPRAYLTTIANGLVINHWRRQALEQAYLEILQQQPEPIVPSHEETALVIEKLEQLARMLDGLPIRAKQVFLLARLDGLAYKQIAERLDISVNMVQKAMTLAIANCYHALYD